MSVGIKRLVMDVMKPRDLSLVELADALATVDSVHGVNINLVEIDKDTENIKVTIAGDNLNHEEIIKTLETHGAVMHSLDEVVSGKKIIESVDTLQD